ncbi:DUF3291 domain-containing protein [Flavobacteriaceae bacterium TP-CH-4]|uniref:DUF3291 domain-containing protein n=1 Tax=Pelagihabitans pacificus TaxID=2696054 RepID=A0A967B3L9_9FLAO|nr:DUF3291 domain-containing protein [Pelagihabitans pacificus]NHF61421.1 DUF3291 domain-containing protein [Pelagihabitans pacificus]
MNHYLAQINISRFKAPLGDRSMKEFVDFLEPVNKLAEESEGFIWRLKDEDGLPSSYLPSPFEDDGMMAMNMSVWENMDSFKNFVYGTVHSYFLKNKKQWFEPIGKPYFVMWWVAKNEIPTIQEGKEKLDLYLKVGPSPQAFTFRELFDAQGLPMT